MAYQYFRYQSEMSKSIILKVDDAEMESHWPEFFKSLGFENIKDKFAEISILQVINVKKVTPLVHKNINRPIDLDRFGRESLIESNHYLVYRFFNLGMMVFSKEALEWNLALMPHFGLKNEMVESRMLFNRVLSFSLLKEGIIGFWGVLVDRGLVVQRPMDSKGEAVFVDVNNREIYSIDGNKKMPSAFHFLRMDHTLKGERRMKMSKEELLTFLESHTTHLDLNLRPMKLNYAIQWLSKWTEGFIFAEENFRPRVEIS